ncbi:MAG TPA: VanZ family protein [Verrucomicrobiota bacterium]|nr:VanZ family protein [Verrucomicrobiota bacterium]
MSRIRIPLVWLPVALWMLLIFLGSTDALSVRRTSRIIGPVLRWFIPDISDAAIRQVQTGVRKTGHAVQYAILAGLVWRALNEADLGFRRPWPRRLAVLSWALATGYAVTDEIHQSFIPSRQGQVTDVLFDSAGAAVAIGLIWWWGRRRQRWESQSARPATSARAHPT